MLRPSHGFRNIKMHSKWTQKCGDISKIRVILRKLGTTENEHCINSILPKNPKDIFFESTNELLLQIFDEQSSLFKIRCRYLQLVKPTNITLRVVTSGCVRLVNLKHDTYMVGLRCRPPYAPAINRQRYFYEKAK